MIKGWSASELTAWVAAIGAAIALATQVWGMIKKGRADRQKIDAALDRSPEVKQKLALGNVGDALAHLNTIIETQNAHIEVQRKRQEVSDREIEQFEAREASYQVEIQELREANRGLVASSVNLRQEAAAEKAALQEELDATKRAFARALRQNRPTTEEDGS